MKSYAKINSENKVIEVIFTSYEYTSSEYVLIPYYITDLLGAIYSNGEFIKEVAGNENIANPDNY